MSPDILQSRFSDRMRTVLIVVGVLLILLLGIGMMVALYFYRGQKNQNDFALAAYRATSSQLNSVQTELEITKNSLGQEKSKTVVLQGDNSTLKELIKNKNIEQMRYLDDRLQEFGVRLQDLKSVTNLKVETSGQFFTVTRDSIISTIKKALPDQPQDTIKQTVKTFSYSDSSGWFSMKGIIKADSINIIPTYYNIYDVIINEEKGKKRYFLDLFPPRRTVAQVVNRNPYSKTTGLNTIVKKTRRRILGIF